MDTEIDPIIDEEAVEETPEPVEESKPEPKPAPKQEPVADPLESRKARLERELARVNRALGADEPAPSKKTDETGEIEALLLEVKNVTHEDDVALFEKWKADTGRSARQILSSEIFLKELEAQRQVRAVKDATPSGTKRAGGSTDDVAAAIARFDATQELPEDFQLRSAVVNALTERSSGNKPAWG